MTRRTANTTPPESGRKVTETPVLVTVPSPHLLTVGQK